MSKTVETLLPLLCTVTINYKASKRNQAQQISFNAKAFAVGVYKKEIFLMQIEDEYPASNICTKRHLQKQYLSATQIC